MGLIFLKKYCLFLFVSFLVASPLSLFAQTLFKTDAGLISFESDAPLELIKASSNQLKGVINPADKTFAFSVKVNALEGFNSPLQKEHFNENYLESKQFPYATFTGKIIEKIDFNQIGQFEVRAKGLLTVHGESRERIIKSKLIIKPEEAHIESTFSVLLDDYQISIPRIVNQKIAEEIKIRVEAVLQKVKE